MSTAAPAYRVVHHEHGLTRDLGRMVGVAAHPSTLDPFVSALLRDGRGGRLELVEEVSGQTVATRAVRPFRRASAPAARPRRDPR